MSLKPKILAFSGSSRSESFNKKLVKLAASAATKAGAEVTLIDLRDLQLPLYDGDLEEKSGVPDSARKFRGLIVQHQGLMIASPEYNASVSPLLKNAIDWASRPIPNETNPYAGKIAMLMSASPGGLGGLRGQIHVRAILDTLTVITMTESLAVMKAHEAFNADGSFKEPKQQATLEKLAARFVTTLEKLAL
jgi:chromate reductase